MKTKNLECLYCEFPMTIQRRDSKNRPAGHVKHMWCPRCQARRPFIELDEFRREFSANMDRIGEISNDS